jgi:hypothetical protein
MSKYFAESFMNMDEVVDYLNEKQPTRWSIVFSEENVWHYEVFVEVAQ